MMLTRIRFKDDAKSGRKLYLFMLGIVIIDALAGLFAGLIPSRRGDIPLGEPELKWKRRSRRFV